MKPLSLMVVAGLLVACGNSQNQDRSGSGGSAPETGGAFGATPDGSDGQRGGAGGAGTGGVLAGDTGAEGGDLDGGGTKDEDGAGGAGGNSRSDGASGVDAPLAGDAPIVPNDLGDAAIAPDPGAPGWGCRAAKTAASLPACTCEFPSSIDPTSSSAACEGVTDCCYRYSSAPYTVCNCLTGMSSDQCAVQATKVGGTVAARCPP